MKEANLKTQDSFFSSIGVSIAFHLAVVAIFLVKTISFPTEPLIYESAIRVDIVDLPDKIDTTQPIGDLPEPAKKEEEKLPEKIEEPIKEAAKPQATVEKPAPVVKTEKSKDKDAVNLDKIKNKQAEALKKLKAMSALEEIEQQVAEENKPKGQKPKYKGTVLSAGTSLTGVNQLQHEAYLGNIDQHVKKNWSLPQWLANKNYKAQALIKLDERGNVIENKIVKSSGNPDYDDEVLTAIQRSSPFPPPPEKFLDIVAVNGILLGFPE